MSTRFMVRAGVLVRALPFLVAACASQEAAPPDAALPADAGAPDAPSIPIACPELSVDAGGVRGVIYEREPFRSYTLDGPFFNGVDGAIVGSSARSEPCGRYASNAAPLQTITVRADGFIDLAFMRFSEAHVHQDVGLYRAPVAVMPRPGFMKGVWPAQDGAGASAHGAYVKASALGANVVVVRSPIQITAYDAAQNTITMRADLPEVEVWGERAAEARALGLDLLIFLPVASQSSAYDEAPQTDELFDAWFTAYAPVVADIASRAQRAGVAALAVRGPHRASFGSWKAVITAMRAAGYTGKIMFVSRAAVEGPEPFVELEHANHNSPGPFLAQFDAIALRVENLHDATRPRSRDAMRDSLRDLAGRTARGKPVVIIVDTPATPTGAWTVAEDFIGACAGLVPDLQLQADVYQAAFEAANAGAPVGGVVTTQYWSSDDGCAQPEPGYVADPSASVRGKPAEAVLDWWFHRL